MSSKEALQSAATTSSSSVIANGFTSINDASNAMNASYNAMKFFCAFLAIAPERPSSYEIVLAWCVRSLLPGSNLTLYISSGFFSATSSILTPPFLETTIVFPPVSLSIVIQKYNSFFMLKAFSR